MEDYIAALLMSVSIVLGIFVLLLTIGTINRVVLFIREEVAFLIRELIGYLYDIGWIK
jgi:hypothetical protein